MKQTELLLSAMVASHSCTSGNSLRHYEHHGKLIEDLGGF